MRTTFDVHYPEGDWQNLNITPEFPMKPQDYPAIWVDFSDTEPLERAGIDHHEIILDDQQNARAITRYRFGGEFSFTVAALSSLEMARLYDQLVRVLSFTGVGDTPADEFKSAVEANDLIDILFSWDVLSPSPGDTNPGTPWGSNEVIYEKTLTIPCIGTYVSDPGTSTLIPLSRIQTDIFIENNDGSLPDDFPDLGDNTDNPYDTTQWI